MKKIILSGLIALFCVLTISACSGNAGKSLTDGVYTVSAKGYGADVVLDVTIAGGDIKEIAIKRHAESEGYGDRAVDALPGLIVERQSLDVDAVTGATITSRAILKAVADAITMAGGDPSDFGYTPVTEIAAEGVITVIGLPGGAEASYTGTQLMQLASVTLEAESVNSSGTVKETTATGVLLETLLNELGVSQTDYESIITTATDGYTIEIPKDVLLNRDILIAWEVDGEPQSLRTVVPDERAMYWTKFLSTIELRGAAEKASVDTVYIFETMLDGVTAEDYKYYDSIDKAVPVLALLEKYITARPEFISLTAIDGLTKNDRYDTVAAQYIKHTGDFAPMFIGPYLPEGMRVKNMLAMTVGSECILSMAAAFEYAKVTEESGIPLSTLLEITGMTDGSVYCFEAADGYIAEINKADIGKGEVFIKDGGINIVFGGLPKNTSVKGLLSIKLES